MNEYIAIALAAIIVMAIGYPIVTALDKWRKEMGEGGEDEE